MSIYVNDIPKCVIDQGVIVNGCIAEHYNCDVCGVVITPRCDIGNGGKVSTIHYLPIVPLHDWIHVDCITNAIDKFKKNLSHKLIGNDISDSLLEYPVEIDDFKKIVNKCNQKDTLIESYGAYLDVINNKNYSCKELIKYCKTEYADLYQGKHNRYYLINNWEDPTNYNVIILRDIKSISFDLINKFSKGCHNKNFDENVYLLNDIYRSDSLYHYRTLAQISSPYIEHILQKYSYNFCRIGVENHINEDDFKEIYKLEKIIKR